MDVEKKCGACIGALGDVAYDSKRWSYMRRGGSTVREGVFASSRDTIPGQCSYSK